MAHFYRSADPQAIYIKSQGATRRGGEKKNFINVNKLHNPSISEHNIQNGNTERDCIKYLPEPDFSFMINQASGLFTLAPYYFFPYFYYLPLYFSPLLSDYLRYLLFYLVTASLHSKHYLFFLSSFYFFRFTAGFYVSLLTHILPRQSLLAYSATIKVTFVSSIFCLPLPFYFICIKR